MRNTPSALGQFIYTHRRSLDLSRADLVERLAANGYECTESAISHWEHGRAAPPIEDPTFARALSLALNVPPSELLRASGVLDHMSPAATKEISQKFSPETLELLKEAGPKDIKRIEAVIKALLTEM